jgi:hypothetical protein
MAGSAMENGPVSDFRGGDVLYIPEGRKHEIASTGMEEAEFFFYRVSRRAGSRREKQGRKPAASRSVFRRCLWKKCMTAQDVGIMFLPPRKTPVCPCFTPWRIRLLMQAIALIGIYTRTFYELGIVRDGEGTVSFEGGPVFSFKKRRCALHSRRTPSPYRR